MSELYQHSDQNFLTTVTSEETGLEIDAADFSSAEYKIFEQDCTTVLVSKSLGSGIVVEGTDFKTTLDAADMNMLPADYIHQFKVVNTAAQTLPPIFQGPVTVKEVCN